VVDVQLDKSTNRLATPSCPETYTAAFVAGTEPHETCDQSSGIGGFFSHLMGLGDKPLPPPPSFPERMETLLRQIQLACLDKGEELAMLEARKQASFYFRGIRGAAAIREQLNRIEKYDQLRGLAESVCREYEGGLLWSRTTP
jgi:tRNA-dihydrouridine synthase